MRGIPVQKQRGTGAFIFHEYRVLFPCSTARTQEAAIEGSPFGLHGADANHSAKQEA